MTYRYVPIVCSFFKEINSYLCAGGTPVWGELVLALVFLVAIGGTIHLYRSQEARERVRRWGQEMRAR
jgi:hypothetical protein